jgi:hypothetical protein
MVTTGLTGDVGWAMANASQAARKPSAMAIASAWLHQIHRQPLLGLLVVRFIKTVTK